MEKTLCQKRIELNGKKEKRWAQKPTYKTLFGGIYPRRLERKKKGKWIPLSTPSMDLGGSFFVISFVPVTSVIPHLMRNPCPCHPELDSGSSSFVPSFSRIDSCLRRNDRFTPFLKGDVRRTGGFWSMSSWIHFRISCFLWLLRFPSSWTRFRISSFPTGFLACRNDNFLLKPPL